MLGFKVDQTNSPGSTTEVRRLEPLTSEAFAPFGDIFLPPVIGEVTPIAKRLQNLRPQSEFQCYINHHAQITLPHTVSVMERHRFSSQAFIPLDVSRYIVAVAPADENGLPNLAQLLCFFATNTQAVNYHAGVWHCPMAALDRNAQFAVLMWKDGTEDDTQFVDIDFPIEFLDA
jgi:ureidoglycolate lyase